MTAIWAFLSTTWGRRFGLLLAVLALCSVGTYCHGRAVSNLVDTTRQEAINARDEMWRGKLQAAETAARDTIRRKEASAYQRGVEDEAKRRALDAADAEKTETTIREVVRVSESAASCRYDDSAVAGLNRLRLGQ